MGLKQVRHVGEKFGRLTLIRQLSKQNLRKIPKSYSKWECLCECGKTTVVHATNLLGGITKSCGCLRKEVCRARERKKNYPPENVVLWYYKRNAITRNLNWNLTNEAFYSLTQQPCHYCGHPPEPRLYNKKTIVSNGLDRPNNNQGYEPDNVVPCCKKCNMAKHAMPPGEFITWIRRVAKHTKTWSIA